MNFRPFHIDVSKEDIDSAQHGGRFFFLPGSLSRAERIAEQFTNCRIFHNKRGHHLYTGILKFDQCEVDVATVSTGMGCPSLGIIVSELISLGARRLLRIGTAGSLQPDKVKVSDVVIATGAVRDEGASLSYAPLEVPAVASIEIVQSLKEAAKSVGLIENTHVGLVHSKDSLYAREFNRGPLAHENERYMNVLKSLGVLATEMEASHLFILTQASSKFSSEENITASSPETEIISGCLLAIIGGKEPFTGQEEKTVAIERAIKIGIESVRILYTT